MQNRNCGNRSASSVRPWFLDWLQPRSSQTERLHCRRQIRMQAVSGRSLRVAYPGPHGVRIVDMNNAEYTDGSGPFEARYLAFLETIANLRPSLHRYCSRMTGSVLDGEDVVQDALFEAYRKLDQYDESLPLGPWLFRIAHNRCIDFLRRRKVRTDAEVVAVKPDRVMPVDPPGHSLGRAVEHLVLALPPKERACVLLKDVFEYSLEEIAELVDSTVG